MSPPTTSRTPTTILIFAGAVGGVGVALYNLLTPLTGVTGTAGAKLVTVACVLIAVAAVLIQLFRPGPWRGIFRFLAALGAVLTAIAGYFLHEWWLIAAMVIVLVGGIYDITSHPAAKEEAMI